MNARNEEIKERYHQEQRQGMQDLRFMLLLLALFLVLYTALGFYIVWTIQEKELYLSSYLIFEVGSFIAWLIPIRLLWNFNRLGRILFLLCTCASIYIYRDIIQIFYIEIHPEMYKYIGIALFISKCTILLYCTYRLMFGKSIRMIWNIDTIFDEDLELMDASEADENVPKKEMDPFVVKAQKMLKRAAIRLGVILYLSILVIMLSLSLLQVHIPALSEGIEFIQYTLFSACLFSVMLWSGPVIALYIAKTWSPYLLYGALLGEIIRIGISYQSYVEIFSNIIIPLEVKVLYVMIELLRYILLIYACRGILHSRLIKKYSKMKLAEK